MLHLRQEIQSGQAVQVERLVAALPAPFAERHQGRHHPVIVVCFVFTENYAEPCVRETVGGIILRTHPKFTDVFLLLGAEELSSAWNIAERPTVVHTANTTTRGMNAEQVEHAKRNFTSRLAYSSLPVTASLFSFCLSNSRATVWRKPANCICTT